MFLIFFFILDCRFVFRERCEFLNLVFIMFILIFIFFYKYIIYKVFMFFMDFLFGYLV